MKRQAGYTYISILIVVFALALTAQATWIPQSTTVRRAAEAELIFRGTAYRAAIESYYKLGGAQPRYPEDLESLLADPRFQDVRHIRVLYDVPRGFGRWTLVYSPSGGVSGVAPESSERPFKMAGFPKELEHFEDAQNYRDWTFTYIAPE